MNNMPESRTGAHRQPPERSGQHRRPPQVLAEHNGRSMGEEARELIAAHLAESGSVLRLIKESWAVQTRRPTAEEIDRWMGIGRP